jgi:hypothetical protein
MATSAVPPRSETISHPFERFADVPEQGRLAQLLRLPDTRAASAALERTLARLAPRVPSAGEVAGIFRHFKVSSRQARQVSIALWSRMFHHCRRHGEGSGEAQHYLAALLLALDLRESDVDC